MMRSPTKWVGTIRARLIVSIGVAGALALVTQTAGQSDTLTTDAPISLGCQADPAGLIASLPPGGVFDGHGACYITNGILIDHPNLTIRNATFIDPLTAEPTTTRGYDGLKPIIRIKTTAFITLTNLTLNGQNSDGGYHRDLVGE